MRIALLSLFLFQFGFTTAQLPDVVCGKVERLEDFPSKYIKPRNVDVWLPPGYTKGKKYAVLYMQDGQMLFDGTRTWNSQEWGVDETMQMLLQNHQIKETIVVGIWNAPDFWLEYFPAKPFATIPAAWQDSIFNGMMLKKTNMLSDQYLKFMVYELKPYIDSAYSTRKDKANTYLAGSDMGALLSLYGVCEYPKVFGGAACLSTHWPGGLINTGKDNQITASAFNKYLKTKLPSPADHRFYFDHGTIGEDKAYGPYQKMIDKTMKEKLYSSKNWMTLTFSSADHTEDAWRKRFAGPLFFLLRQDILVDKR